MSPQKSDLGSSFAKLEHHKTLVRHMTNWASDVHEMGFHALGPGCTGVHVTELDAYGDIIVRWI